MDSIDTLIDENGNALDEVMGTLEVTMPEIAVVWDESLLPTLEEIDFENYTLEEQDSLIRYSLMSITAENFRTNPEPTDAEVEVTEVAAEENTDVFITSSEPFEVLGGEEQPEPVFTTQTQPEDFLTDPEINPEVYFSAAPDGEESVITDEVVIFDEVTPPEALPDENDIQTVTSTPTPANEEILEKSGRYVGGETADHITGSAHRDVFKGAAGDDVLDGGAGNDRLHGEAGADVLSGGEGRDRFIFKSADESGITAETRDTITDFVSGEDKIKLAKIDANTEKSGNQAFKQIISADAEFTQAGQLQIKDGILYGNTDNDSDAEFSIALTGISTIAMTDIIA